MSRRAISRKPCAAGLMLLIVPIFLGNSLRATGVETPVLFDFGTSTSPVASSAIRVTGQSDYQESVGFGWTTQGQAAFDRDQPLAELRHGGNPMRPDLLYHSHVTPMNRDGVASQLDMRFRVDVNPGIYRVHVWVGDLHESLESLALDCNGKAIATGISAKHIIGRSLPESTGFYARLRFDVDAASGKIELRFYGDESQYLKNQARYDKWFPDDAQVESYLGGSWDRNRKLKFDPLGPFKRNSVLAVRVFSRRAPLIAWDGPKLVPVRKVAGQADRFMAAFNHADFRTAESILDEHQSSQDLRIRGYLTLLGHPQIEGTVEERLLAKAQQVVDEAARSGPQGIWIVEARECLSVFARARHRFHRRGMAQEGHFQENRKVVSMMRLFRPGDLLYYKALEYQGRALQMLDPHRWVYPSGDAQQVWKQLSKAFPNNRYAKFYLTDEWSPDEVWSYNDRLVGIDGAPDWASAQQQAWGLLLDICQWWADHKQHPDGSIGGGWGDDVELVALFGIMGIISEDAAQPSIDLAVKLIDGLWKHGGIDQQAGFYRGLLDAEHSAEWTGDTLPLMLSIDGENPIWIQRATKTARLMRNLWMDYNQRGDLHFRSNFLGSNAIGNQDQANDSYINFRAVLPAIAVYRYNRHPEIGKLLVEWADAWLADAMRTDRGKPRGVFPAEVGFPSGRLGGTRSPNWYTSAHPPGTVNYDWERGSYYGYLVDLMLLAQEITGDEKYVAPFELQRKLVDDYRKTPIASPKPGTAPWVGKILSEGSYRGRQPFDEIWQRVQLATANDASHEPPVLIDRTEVLRRMDFVCREAKRRWPVLTTETSATDRVGFRGIADPFVVMTAAQGVAPSVTYSGVGRKFAAFVKKSGTRHLTVVMYNFAEHVVTAVVRPWNLEVGGTYQVRMGIDTDGDDVPDQRIRQEDLVLEQRGQRIEFSFAPGATTVIQVRQTQPGRGTTLHADLAAVPHEIKYSIWSRALMATVHNVGSYSAKRFSVSFYEQDGSTQNKIGQVQIPHLSWPKDFLAQTTTIAVPYIPRRSNVAITVVIDEANRVDEISETNNQATRQFVFDLDEIRAPRNLVGEIGGDLTGEIQRGIR